METAPARPVIAVLALGSNLGASAHTLSEAIAELGAAEGVEVVAESPRVVTAPVGGPEGQPDYLNQVIEVHTTLAPLALLELAHRVEQAHHRERIVRWGPRTLDIDIITFGTLTSEDEELTLPHPRAAERGFVLVPWSWMDPGAFVGGKSVFELAELAADTPGVRAYQPPVEAGDAASGTDGA
ncbi:2-amino-4-hydroxy-6-hydroxymethyldihydropteridine diphosphokinase [Galactobacter valiniphilus]|uniref:2-amino-4-hydroxy-6- hydroxymethyldihydropteridine diphosphokinase n=1 Tax=Galactobacter valiniphilus TaxID=2676122 RepID=UPI003735DD3B